MYVHRCTHNSEIDKIWYDKISYKIVKYLIPHIFPLEILNPSGWQCALIDLTPVFLGSTVAQLVKNLPAIGETWLQSLGWEDTLEKGKATHSVFWLENSMDCISPWGYKDLDKNLSVLLILHLVWWRAKAWSLTLESFMFFGLFTIYSSTSFRLVVHEYKIHGKIPWFNSLINQARC